MDGTESIEYLKEVLKARIGRFVGEMAPYWRKESVQKEITFSRDINDPDIQKMFQELEDEGVIHLVRDDKYYFIVTESFIRNIYRKDKDVADIFSRQANAYLKEVGYDVTLKKRSPQSE